MTTQHSSLTVSLPSDREILMTREFDAPRELVFETMTSPEHLVQWWGPRRFTLTIERMDFRVGGGYRFVQRDAEGNEFAFRGEYREIVPPERAVQTFEWEGLPGHISLETMTLEDLGGRTRLTIRSLLDSIEDRDGLIQSGMQQGASESYDRLEEHLRRLV